MPEEIIEVIGAAETRQRLAGVQERMAHPGFGFATVMRSLEQREESIFESYGGKYVRTGATKESLTSTASAGAIRQLLPNELNFGTSVPQAMFQGTTGAGHHRGPSAIMQPPTEAEALAAEKSILAYVMAGGRL